MAENPSCPLLAVALVTKDAVAPAKLLFWYPHSTVVRTSGVSTSTSGTAGSDGRYGLQAAHVRVFHPTIGTVERSSSLHSATAAGSGGASSGGSNTSSKNGTKKQLDAADIFARGFDINSGNLLADTLIPSSAIWGRNMELTVDKATFIGYPSILQKVPHGDEYARAYQEGGTGSDGDTMSASGAGTHVAPSSTSKEPTRFVANVVLVVRAGTPRNVINAYHSLVQRITVGLQHEQRRVNYVSSEINAMIAQHDVAATAAVVDIGSPDHILTRMLGKSQLARNLRSVYSGIQKSQKVQIKLGGWVNLSFRNPVGDSGTVSSQSPRQHFRRHTARVAAAAMVQEMRPYHTLLLDVAYGSSRSTKASENELLQRLPVDSSVSLHRFVQCLSPFKTLEEIALEMDVSLSQLFRMAQHLIHWHEATLIYPICAPNVYIVSPDFDLDLLCAEHMAEFAARFNRRPLSTILMDFSTPRSLGAYMRPFEQGKAATRSQQLQMVQYLLQRRIIVLLRTYVMLKIPKKQPASIIAASQGPSHGPTLSSSLPASPLRARSVRENPVWWHQRKPDNEPNPLETASQDMSKNVNKDYTGKNYPAKSCSDNICDGDGRDHSADRINTSVGGAEMSEGKVAAGVNTIEGMEHMETGVVHTQGDTTHAESATDNDDVAVATRSISPISSGIVAGGNAVGDGADDAGARGAAGDLHPDFTPKPVEQSGGVVMHVAVTAEDSAEDSMPAERDATTSRHAHRSSECDDVSILSTSPPVDRASTSGALSQSMTHRHAAARTQGKDVATKIRTASFSSASSRIGFVPLTDAELEAATAAETHPLEGRGPLGSGARPRSLSPVNASPPRTPSVLLVSSGASTPDCTDPGGGGSPLEFHDEWFADGHTRVHVAEGRGTAVTPLIAACGVAAAHAVGANIHTSSDVVVASTRTSTDAVATRVPNPTDGVVTNVSIGMYVGVEPDIAVAVKAPTAVPVETPDAASDVSALLDTADAETADASFNKNTDPSTGSGASGTHTRITPRRDAHEPRTDGATDAADDGHASVPERHVAEGVAPVPATQHTAVLVHPNPTGTVEAITGAAVAATEGEQPAGVCDAPTCPTPPHHTSPPTPAPPQDPVHEVDPDAEATTDGGGRHRSQSCIASFQVPQSVPDSTSHRTTPSPAGTTGGGVMPSTPSTAFAWLLDPDSPPGGSSGRESPIDTDRDARGNSSPEVPDVEYYAYVDYLSLREYEYVKNMPEAKEHPTTFDKFLRLCRYFRGAHTIEEMMWREGLSRSDILGTIDVFSRVLYKITT